MGRASLCTWWMLLLELMASQYIAAQPDARIVRKIVQAYIPQVFLSRRPTVLRAGELISVFQKAFTKRVEAWRGCMARGAIECVLARE